VTEPRGGTPVTAIVLLGLMGAGKTTVGRLVADHLDWPLDDSDRSIQAREGRTVRELRDEIGVDAMHALEAGHLLDALAATRPRVITPAAFVIEVPECRAAMAAGDTAVVWLRATAATLAARFWAQPHRPAYGEDPATFLAAQGARRDPWFSAVATLVVDVDDLAPDAVTDRIVASIVVEPRAGADHPDRSEGPAHQ